MSLEYCTVTHSLRSTVPHAPEGITGRARFTPIMPPGDAWTVTTDKGTVTVPAVPVVGVVENGELGPMEVFAGGDNSNPSIAMWRVEYFTLSAGTTTIDLAPMLFKAIPGGNIDLAEIYPVSGSSPAGVVRGRKGDKGDTGDAFTWDDFTPEQLQSLKGDKGDDAPPLTVVNHTHTEDGDTLVAFSDGSEITVRKGEKGDDGISPVLTGGTATTLPAGSAPTVDIAGTSSHPIINVGVPQAEPPGRGKTTWIHWGTGAPSLADFPFAQVDDIILRMPDRAEWKVEP